MNKCLCIKSRINFSPFNRLSASDCNYKCDDYSDNIYSGDCGGESAYNLYETQGVNFTLVESCLSLQCSSGDTRFIPHKCSESLKGLCENSTLSNKDYASNWNLAMEQCRKSQLSTYLLGDINLTDPGLVCERVPHQFDVFWVGVAQQIYTSIDQGWEVNEEQTEAFLECQMCEMNECQFRNCYEFSASSIFCNSTSDGFQGASDQLALKVSLPVIMVIIIVPLCALAVVFYLRRRKMTQADRTTKAHMESGPKENTDSNVDSVQNNSYFVLEQCPQYISKGSDSSTESPYNNSEEGVYDHLRDKISRKPEVEDTYQHASTGVSGDTSEYDTMANTVNKKQEKDASYDYSNQDTNGNYACDLRAKNNLTDNPYDVAV